MSVNPAENRIKLNMEYVQANEEAEMFEQQSRMAQAAFEAAQAELQSRIANGVTDPNDKSSLNPFFQKSNELKTKAFLASSFATFKGQEYINSCFRCIG